MVLPLVLGGLWVLPGGIVLLSAVVASHGAGPGAGAGWTAAAWSLLPVWLVALQAWRRRTEALVKAERAAYNRWVPSVDISEVAPWRNARIDPSEELTPEALGRLRHFFDLALQPIDSYHGYDMIEQKGTAALRYQYAFQQYVTALMQYSHAPAFGTMVGMYTKLHGDGRYGERGSIRFRYSDRHHFDHDFRGMCEDVAELDRADRYHCVPCEPA